MGTGIYNTAEGRGLETQKVTPNSVQSEKLYSPSKNALAYQQSSLQMNPDGFTSARATAYNGLDDKYGDTTARKSSFGTNKAVEGLTIAVDPTLIPYGSKVQVVNSKGEPVRIGDNPDGIYEAHDTGGAVKARTASQGKKPVIDFYSKGNPLNMNKIIGDDIFYKIVNQGKV